MSLLYVCYFAYIQIINCIEIEEHEEEFRIYNF